MANPLGIAIITDNGKNMLADAVLNGTFITPAKFRFSSQLYSADAAMTAEDIPEYWVENDISLYQVVDNDTVEFSMIIEAVDAIDNIQTVSIYLDDGTLFAVANPSYQISKQQRQVIKIQLAFSNMGDVLNFEYLPFDETEQDLALLDTIATLGNQITKNTLDLKGVKFEGVN